MDSSTQSRRLWLARIIQQCLDSGVTQEDIITVTKQLTGGEDHGVVQRGTPLCINIRDHELKPGWDPLPFFNNIDEHIRQLGPEYEDCRVWAEYGRNLGNE